jgi:hypothetical protein
MIKGLLTQKPGRDPQVGLVKNYVVLHMPAVNGKQAWVKIKNPTKENPGSPHKIVNVTPNDYKDSYGNISFNIELEPTSEAPTHQPHPAASALGRGIQQGARNGISKDDYWERKEQRDIDGQRRMGRAHSQEMALRFFQIHGGMPGATTPAEITQKLRDMINWFERDIEYAQHGGEESE